MTVIVKINSDTPAGKKIISELRQYPDTVEFVEPSIVAEEIPEGYVSLKDGLDEVREHVKSLYKKSKGKQI